MRRVLALTFLAILPSTSPASATTGPDPLASGTTRLTLAPSFKRLLASHGVKVTATAPASGRAGVYVLPLATGEVAPTSKSLVLTTDGSLAFVHGKRRVILRETSVRTAAVPLIAKVGGGQLKVAAAESREFSRSGFGSTLNAAGLRLTAKFATRLSKKLALHDVFQQGQLLGSLHAAVGPATVGVLPIGRATLIPDAAFLAKLDSLFVSLSPIAPAERAAGPTFSLPFIPSGTVAPDAGSGVPRTGGSLEFLQLGAGQIFWHELWFDLAGKHVLAEVDEEPTPAFPGNLGQLPIAGLASSAVSSDPRARTVSVSGAALTLTSQTAAQFNEAFAKPQGKSEVFHDGEILGSLSFTARTR